MNETQGAILVMCGIPGALALWAIYFRLGSILDAILRELRKR